MRLRFGSFVYDTASRDLTRDGAPLALTPKAARLLELLLDAAPDPVPRETLVERLWPGTFVEPGNLHNLISEIRRALGDEEHTLIRTVHARGYAFAGEVTAESDARFRLIIGDDELPLHAGENVIGRDETRTPDVSRRHARITIDGDSALLEDLGSKNGTFLGSMRIERPTALHDGDEIVLGRTRALFRAVQLTTLTVT